MSKVFWKAFFGAVLVNFVVLGAVFGISMLFMTGFMSSIYVITQVVGLDLLEPKRVIHIALCFSGATTLMSFLWSMCYQKIRDAGVPDED